MSARVKPPARSGPMTVEEFCELPNDPTGARWQLIDGEPAMMAPASAIHAAIQGNLAFILNRHLRASRPGCIAVTAPGIVPRVRRAHNVRIPDLAVHCGVTRRGEMVLDAPLVAIEVLSVSNHAQTWANVWTYCSIPSLCEILVIRTASRFAEILRREPDGNWPEEFSSTGESVELESIGLQFPLVDAYYTTEVFDD